MINVQKIESEFQVNTTTDETQQNPAIASFDNGRYIVTWESFTGTGTTGWEIIGQRYNPNGNSIGKEFVVNTNSTGPQLSSSVSYLIDGGFVVSWHSSLSQDGSGDGIFAQRYDSNGEKVGDEFQVNSFTNANQRVSSVAGLEDGGFVIVWQSDGQDGSGWGIYGKRYDVNGEVVGEEFQVNSFTNLNQQLPSVTDLPDGGFVVTWDSDGQDGSSTGVIAKRYGADGVPLEEEFIVNTTTTSSQSNASITDLPDGGFVVTWQSLGAGFNNTDIYAQRYTANGEKVGEEFLVNTTTEGQQANPYIARNDGGFVITWQGQSGEDWNVFGQAYDSSGNPIGSEFQVNTTTDNIQWTPVVAGLQQEEFVVVWTSEAQDGDQKGIFGQHFDYVEISISELAPTLFEVINESQAAGNEVEIQFAVENTGGEIENPFDVDFYISDNNWISENDRFLASYTVEELAENSTQEDSINLTLPPTGDSFWSLGDGTYYLGMIVDGKNTVAETDEENNSNQGQLISYDELIVQYTIDSPDVDLAPVEFGFDVITEPGNTGDILDVLFTVQNTGTGIAGQFDVDFYISDNVWISEDDKLLGSYAVDGVQGGETFSAITSLTLPGAEDGFWNGSKNYYIGMIIDGKNTVFETDENNNVNVGYGIGDYGKFTGWDDIEITIL